MDGEDQYDRAWLDEELLKLYTQIGNKIGARKLVGKKSDALQFALEQIEHVRLDLQDIEAA